MYKNKMKNIEKGPSAQNKKMCSLCSGNVHTRTHTLYIMDVVVVYKFLLALTNAPVNEHIIILL